MVSNQKIRGALKKLGYENLLGHSYNSGRISGLSHFSGVIRITQGYDSGLPYNPRNGHPVDIEIYTSNLHIFRSRNPDESMDAYQAYRNLVNKAEGMRLLTELAQKLTEVGFDAKVESSGSGIWEGRKVVVREK